MGSIWLVTVIGTPTSEVETMEASEIDAMLVFVFDLFKVCSLLKGIVLPVGIHFLVGII